MNIFIGTSLLLFLFLAITHGAYARVLLIALLPTYLIKTSMSGIPTNLFELLVVVLVGVTLVEPTARKNIQKNISKLSRRNIFLILCFLLSALIACLGSENIRGSLGILKGWVILPSLVGFLVYGVSKQEQKRILHALLYSGLVVALLGLSQFGKLPRVMSIYDVPNSLALFVAPITTLAIWLAMATRHHFYIASGFVLAGAVLATESLMAASATAVSLCIGLIVFFSPRKKQWISIGIILVIIGGIGALFWLNGKIPYLLTSIQYPLIPTSATVRLQLWSISAELIQQHPLLGIGLGQFEPHYQQILHERFVSYYLQPTAYSLRPIPEFVFRDPHNWILSFYLNLGLVGLLSFTALNTKALLWLKTKSTDHYRQSAWVGLICMLLFGLADTIYWKNDLATLWWIFLGLLL